MGRSRLRWLEDEQNDLYEVNVKTRQQKTSDNQEQTYIIKKARVFREVNTQ